jgi:hypothetical protein
MVQSQPRQIVHKTLFQKAPSQKKGAAGMTPSVGPNYKPQYCFTKNNYKYISKKL